MLSLRSIMLATKLQRYSSLCAQIMSHLDPYHPPRPPSPHPPDSNGDYGKATGVIVSDLGHIHAVDEVSVVRR